MCSEFTDKPIEANSHAVAWGGFRVRSSQSAASMRSRIRQHGMKDSLPFEVDAS